MAGDGAQAAEAFRRFDLILDTISGPHHIPQLPRLLAPDGTLSVVGYLSPIELNLMNLSFGRKRLTSSGTEAGAAPSRCWPSNALDTA
jgi:uncharacterized zinc-type alcohol dehydrogenase-like protein